jgi:hypothetical protein
MRPPTGLRPREHPARQAATPLAEADEAAGLAKDEMVENLDAEELAGRREPAREGDILGGRLGVAARVVVGQQEGGGNVHEGGLVPAVVGRRLV